MAPGETRPALDYDSALLANVSLPAGVSFRSLLDLPPRLARAVLPPPATTYAAMVRRVRSRLWLYAIVVAVWFGYAWLASAGGLEHWPTYGWFHDHQAEAFRQGKLSLPIKPAPELLLAKNPFDPVNLQYWVLDASYHDGEYYAYWGPVPALLQAVGKTLLGIDHGIGDQYVQFFHLCLGVACGALLVERITRRLFPAVSNRLIALGVLVFAAANPTLHTVATPSTYHTAIAAAQAWLVAGLLVAFDAVWRAGTNERRALRLVFAGALWSLAVASRVTVAPAIAAMVLATAWAVGFAVPTRRFRRFAGSGLLLGAPLALVCAALLAYNELRFDNPFEFGTNLQLAAFPLFKVSEDYLLPNLYSYVFRPFEASCRFPYVFQAWRVGPAAFPEGMVWPPGYMAHEPVVGWFWAIPLTWLAPFAFLFLPRPLGASVRRVRAYVWCLVSFLALATLTGLVGMGVYGTTMRYMGDVTYGIVLLALLGSYALRAHRLGRYAPRTLSLVIGVLGAATIFFGLALGYHGYNAHVERLNPALDARLVGALSVCGEVPPAPLRYAP